jgi:hypothetical protein
LGKTRAFVVKPYLSVTRDLPGRYRSSVLTLIGCAISVCD